MRTAGIFVIIASFALFIVARADTASAASEPLIKSQPPCTPAQVGKFFCVAFTASTTPVTIRGVTLDAPGRGTAQVTFHGTMNCQNNTASDSGFQLQTQIVDDPSATPSAIAAGGLDFFLLVNAFQSQTMNLASTRAFKIDKKGTYKFYFRMKADAAPATNVCSDTNSTFSMVFVPR